MYTKIMKIKHIFIISVLEFEQNEEEKNEGDVIFSSIKT